MTDTKKILELSKKYETPFYIYDGTIIESQYTNLVNAFSNTSKVQVNYAMKALSTISILQFMKQLGCCVDTVSINEVKLALTAGFTTEEIFYTPNGAPFNEIFEVYNMGVHITLDNLIQIEQIAQLNATKGIAVRLNPNIEAGANEKIKVAKKDSKFGLPLTDIDNLKKISNKYSLHIDGFHIHLGSGIADISSFKESAQVLFDIAKQFKGLKFINFGGGFKVQYTEEDTFINIQEIGTVLSDIFNTFKKEYKEDILLILEPGKFLVSNSGKFITEVSTVKGQNVFVNSGFNHLIRPMYYDAFHQITNISSTEKSNKDYHIVGYICEQDSFGENRRLTKPHVGDIICIENAGAYCFTMASNYNARLRPMELFMYNNETKIIRNKETFENLLLNQVY